MKSLTKVVLFVIAITVAGSMANSSPVVRSAGRAAPVPAPVGTLYRQKCSKCHGADGDGDTSMGRIFNAPDFTDPGWWAKHDNTGELVRVITRGKKSMPAFGKKLSRAQISSLASYVRTFKR